MASGGGGSTTTTEASPELRQLQASALPQISQTITQNPLSQFAQWMPRQVAGTNPLYEAAFKLTPSLAAPTPAMDFLWGRGQQQSVFPGRPVPEISTGPFSTIGPRTAMPGPLLGLSTPVPGTAGLTSTNTAPAPPWFANPPSWLTQLSQPPPWWNQPVQNP